MKNLSFGTALSLLASTAPKGEISLLECRFNDLKILDPQFFSFEWIEIWVL